jgi:hypothetical protein
MQLTFSRTSRSTLAVLAAAAWLCASGGALAATLSYSITLSESQPVLDNPTNKSVAHMEAWIPQHSLMLKRTMPYVELLNTSEEGEITQFMMTIGDESKNFDWLKIIETSPGVTVTLQSPDMVMDQLRTDVLKLDFSGLTPGKFVRFRTLLAPDDKNLSPIVDYRTTLFQLNGAGTSNNSAITVSYDTPTGPTSQTDMLPDFVNPMPTVTSLRFRTHYMDNVMPYTAQFSTTAPPIPEPASVVLLGIGLASLIAWRLTKRGRESLF